MEHLNYNEILKIRLEESANLKMQICNDENIQNGFKKVVTEILNCYKIDGKVLFCGNGGSAADAQHLAAELSGRFYYDRKPLFAEALHVNTSYITAVANDYSYGEIYSRLVEANGRKGDVLIGLSTSGNSENIIKAFKKAKEKELITVAFTGKTGGNLKQYADILIPIPSVDTPRIQECHMLIGHTLCELIEKSLFPQK